ncbi:hypothetical protein F9C07_2349 [Aspergillus flavus]|uniref:Uncharacterized protein n=1 Tax=Aspergillus flavus (strain ATCC 200026 / FGSC A1120 / IAM 13836 / NRRL 3357 / JCM 12722 / SRRC 167) TaxID=332952 RepID=A0A7U2QS51_ASPFN|nr:hypothetical protein F9C07_2349 [Aspergillus flavus]
MLSLSLSPPATPYSCPSGWSWPIPQQRLATLRWLRLPSVSQRIRQEPSDLRLLAFFSPCASSVTVLRSEAVLFPSYAAKCGQALPHSQDVAAGLSNHLLGPRGGPRPLEAVEADLVDPMQ